MPQFHTGTVVAIVGERRGLQRCHVDLSSDGGKSAAPAYVLTGLIGPVAVGDEVVVNTTAVDLDLGSGGWHVVHWNLARRSWGASGGGHILKMRYTSLQVDVGVAEEVGGYTPPQHLGGVPVVACALHSQVPCVAAAFAARAGDARLVYVMTDGAALPLALSDIVAGLCESGLLAATVTAGQAFGGDLEAVNVASALDVAVAVGRADAIVVSGGPGVVGTGTGRGFSGLEVAGIVDAAAFAGATPIVAVRYSSADARVRHRGVSHHTTAALAAAARGALVAAPPGGRAAFAGLSPARHEVRVVATAPDVDALLRARGLAVTTMGRDAVHDPGFFSWAAAAGTLAAELLAGGGWRLADRLG